MTYSSVLIKSVDPSGFIKPQSPPAFCSTTSAPGPQSSRDTSISLENSLLDLTTWAILWLFLGILGDYSGKWQKSPIDWSTMGFSYFAILIQLPSLASPPGCWAPSSYDNPPQFQCCQTQVETTAYANMNHADQGLNFIALVGVVFIRPRIRAPGRTTAIWTKDMCAPCHQLCIWDPWMGS